MGPLLDVGGARVSGFTLNWSWLSCCRLRLGHSLFNVGWCTAHSSIEAGFGTLPGDILVPVHSRHSSSKHSVLRYPADAFQGDAGDMPAVKHSQNSHVTHVVPVLDVYSVMVALTACLASGNGAFWFSQRPHLGCSFVHW